MLLYKKEADRRPIFFKSYELMYSYVLNTIYVKNILESSKYNDLVVIPAVPF